MFEHEGALDKFVGEAIMALWGAPVGQPDHAERAVRCSLAIIGTLMEGLTRKYNNHIIISEYTYAKVKDIVQANELDSMTVKGKEKPVVVYDLVGLK